ncbi:LuxR C-terminal-related transcriptional regulator [Nonomuraea longicatena]
MLLVALTALPLAVRRRYPLAAFWTVVSAALATTGGATWITVLSCSIAGYSAVAHSRNRVPAVAGLLLAAVLAGAVDRAIVPSLPGWLGPYVVLLSAGVCASIVRFLRRSRDRQAELRREQEEAMRKAVEAERARIAAELHDVVTHNVSVMVIQAGAARKVMDAEPELSKQALLAIESSGRAAMAELRNVMGLLAGTEGGRADNRDDGLEPQPGLDRLDGLIERVRAAGTPVDVSLSPPDSLPDGVGLTRVVILTTYDLDHYVYAALTAGASGFLLKDVSPEHLVAALRLVRSGDALLAPTITRRLIERFAPRDEAKADLHRDLSELTPRELEVLRLLATGLSNAELADRLTLSATTVKTHVARILSKLGLRDRVQAVVLAYETGLISPGGPPGTG